MKIADKHGIGYAFPTTTIELEINTPKMRTHAFPTKENHSIYFDDLDVFGVLHNARYPLLIERTIGAFWKKWVGVDYRS